MSNQEYEDKIEELETRLDRQNQVIDALLAHINILSQSFPVNTRSGGTGPKDPGGDDQDQGGKKKPG